ncbi:hypothetical protein B7P43_G01679 [Cryptotermes secundus]|uniref:PHD-type domain-containing protein n=5 Tax=Cryptotermes secundus TaxID=105785 RepID=A0A2J7PDR1_9NEOP|nr:hypothetical protein B7P43_G01679 [Cryptotermes secundus]
MTPILKHSLEHKLPSHSGVVQTIKKSDSSYVVFVPDTQTVRSSIGKAEGKRLTNQNETVIQESRQTGNKLSGMEDKSDSKVESQEEGPHPLIQSSEKLPQTVCTPVSVIEVSSLQVSSSKVEKKVEDVTLGTKDLNTVSSKVSEVEQCKPFPDKEKETNSGSTDVHKAVSEEKNIDGRVITSSTHKSPAGIRGKGDKVKGSIVSKVLPKSSDRTKTDDCLPEGRSGVAEVTPVLKDIESETLELPIKKAPEDTKDTKPEVSLKRVMKKDSSKTVSVRSPMSGKLKGENRKEGKTISPKSEDISIVKEVMPKKEIEINSRLRIQDLTFDYAPPKSEEKEILCVKTRIQTRQHGKLPAKLPSSEKPKKGNKTSKSASMASLKVDSSKQEEDVIYIAEKDPLAGADDGFPVTRSRRTRSSTALLTPVDIKKSQPPSKKGSKAEVPIEKSVQKGKLIGQKRRNSRRLDSQSDEGEVVTDGRRKRSLAMVETDEDAGGKRRKLRSRRTPDVQLRRSIEEQKRLEGGYSSSDDDHGDDMTVDLEGESTDESQPTSAAEEVIPRGRGRPQGRACGRGRGRGRGRGGVVSLTATDSPAVSSDAPSDTSRTEPAVISEVSATPKSSPRKTRRLLGLDVGVDIILEETSKEGGAGPSSGMPVRQSRRIAQIKIKEEAERRKLEELTLLELKEQQRRRKRDEKHETKESKSDKRKRKKKTVESDEDYTAEDEVEEPATSKKKKKKKKKRKKKSGKGFSDNPWQSTSGSSSSSLEEEDEQEQTEEEDESNIVFKSDHEFSPESDLENEDVEVQPTRRARTAQKESDGEEPADDHACQKCGKSDHPEWILLCDKCDSGWHGSCLRPALLVIPEGDWFCPPCEHTFLLTNLQNNLKEFDRALKRRENEELRRKRLAYVGISLDNVLPNKEKDAGASGGESDHASKAGKLSSSSSSSSSDSGSSSGDESEPLYHLRERRQTLFSYRFNEYDDLINSAIQDELEAVKGAGNQGRGKDIATIVNAEKEELAAAGVGLEEVEKDSQNAKQDGKLTELEDEQEEAVEAEEEEEDGYIPPVRKFLGRKKHRRLNSLDISSEDDADSDEDFKGTSSEDEDEEEEEEELELDESEDSDVVGRNRRGGSGRRRRNAEPVRRSTRARITRFDKEFINDDSDESIEPRRKKTRRLWQDSDSEESDSTWGQKKRRKHHLDSHKPKSKKKKRKKHMKDLDDEYNKNKPKTPRIKYGGLDDDETSPLPRTRGRKINYQEVAGSESEEELMKAVTKQLESEEEYVASEEEQMMLEEEEDEPEGEEEVEGDAEAEVKSEHKPEPEPEEKAEAKVEAENREEGSQVEEEPRRKEPAIQSVEEEPPLKVGRKKKEKSEKKPRAVKKRRSPNKPKTEKKNKTERKPRKAKPTRMKKQIIRDDTEDELEEFGEEFENLEEGEVRLGTVLAEREELMDEELLEEELVDEEKEMDEMLEEELLEKEMLEEEDDDEFLAVKEAELALQQAELTKAKEKRRQKREAKKLEKKEQKKRGRKAKKLDEVESVQPILISTLADKKHPVQKSAEIESELSKNVEPLPVVPPIILPVVCTSSPAPVVSTPTPAKRRGRGRGKATLAAAAAAAAAASADTTTTGVALAGKLPANGQMGSTPLSGMASSCFPGPNQQPQQLPFCTQPPHSSSSVITRMLQSQPVSGGPQSFTAAATAMGHKYFGGPGNDQLPLVGPGSGNSGSGLGVGTGPSGRGAVSTAQSYSIPARGRIPSPYRQPPPLTSSPSGSPGICLPHYASPRGSPIRPPPGSIQQTAMSPLRMRTSGPGSQGPQLYHTSHHPLDPSPSGGGPIAIAPNNGVRPGGEGSPLHQPPTQIPPSAGSPLAGKPGPSPTSHSTPPPPPYTRVVPPPMHQQVPPPLIRFPLQSADGNPQGRHPQSQFPPSTTAGNHLQQAQHSPPPHQGRSPAPGNFSPYHPPPPPNYHYGAYPPPPPLAAADDALPPSAYQGSPYPDHYASPDASHSLQASDGSNSKSYDEEGGGEFGGLVSYFSSQREDDLDT